MAIANAAARAMNDSTVITAIDGRGAWPSCMDMDIWDMGDPSWAIPLMAA